MLSLRSEILGDSLTQQVTAVSRDTEDNGEPMSLTEEDTCVEEEVKGQVEYYMDYCLDRYAVTYKTQVVYPYASHN